MSEQPAHLWIVGGTRRDRDAALDAVLPRSAAGEFHAVAAHRDGRGPYAGTAALLDLVVPRIWAGSPDKVTAHDVELLSVAPGLESVVRPSRETLTSLAVPEERTRFYGPARTRRLVHGVVEFLNQWAAATDRPVTVRFDAVHAADATEQELLAIALRRVDPARLRIVVATTGDPLPAHAAELAAALDRYAVRVDAPAAAPPAAPREAADLVRAYVESDGGCDDADERAAYEAAPATVRAALHDARAAELERTAPQAHRLGALPYHLERGSDPHGAGLRAVLDAAGRCVDMGFYHAAADLAQRARALADPELQEDAYCTASTRLTSALAVVGRVDEAEEIYFDLRSRFTTPMVHLFSNYALGMLYTRHRAPGTRNHLTARVHLHTAIALASQMPEATRSFQKVFQENGLALVEMHMGNLERAEELVTEGLARLDADLAPGEHELHRSVLLHNRGQVRAARGRIEEGIADLSRVIAADPNHPEYYFDRASLHRRAGDTDAALADYQTAIDVSPPFPEAYYNRGDLRAELGDVKGALADFGYVLELEPDYLRARINRASLLLEGGDPEGARADVAEGLRHDPDSADLLCTRGLLALEDGDTGAALADFTAALEHDPELYEALANRAVIAQEQGRTDDAVDDLTRALELVGPDASLLYNRGYVNRSAGRWPQAIDDFTAALGLPDAERDELLWERAGCRAESGDLDGARSDLGLCAGLDPSPYADRARVRLAELAGA
ncbi:tetratricopeptide repeat protein [Streptomyces sp. NBC_00525]|uniref:tetratricopeptide repeat protein n=1 Tax=Streptomyces sp. NBC_00525 TaxID=2903660 RepID=UPI002E823A31|nr:tetratricopeptide repeat protein [Streptomyces sp. NBC_00525]WUC93721.1 tetratricopeptide repeat protein [Streptomyces sp. NBC_00525]